MSSPSRSSPSSTKAATLAARIDRELRPYRNPTRAAAEKAYLKSELDFLGTGLPAIRRTVAAIKREHPDLDRRTLLALVRILWSRQVHERRMATVVLLETFQPLLTPADLTLLERLIRESRTWAYVDELAVAVVGPLIEREPQHVRVLDRWSTADDFWVRRAAMLALLRPLRRGAGDFTRFGRYAEAMLPEPEFFIRKAIGWVLRETSKKRPNLVYEWLLPRCAVASGVTVREAVKYVSPQQRAALLSAYGSAARPARASARAPR